MEHSIWFFEFRSHQQRKGGGGEEEEEKMDELQVVEFVATYLKKKGFSDAENALQAEIQRNKNSNNSNPIDILNDPELSKFFRSFSEYFSLFLV